MSPQSGKQGTGEPSSLLLVVSLQLGTLLLVFYYTLIGGQTDLAVYSHTWRAVTQWISSALIAGWLLWRWLNPRTISTRPVDGPLLGWLLAWLLATIFSVNPFRSQETMVFFITYLFFFYVAVDLTRSPWLVEVIINAILGAAGLVWTMALLQIGWWYTSQPPIPALLQNNGVTISPSALPRLSVFGNPNTLAAYLVPIIPLALHKLVTSSKWISRLLLAIWLIMLLGVLILTQSRGGLVGLAGGLACYGFLSARRSRLLDIRPRTKSTEALKVGVLALVIVLISYGGVIWYNRGLSIQPDDAVHVRAETMAGALKTLVFHPLVGSGPGTLGEELVRHQSPLREIHAHAHNLFLTLAAETGVVGVIGMIWLAAVVLRKLWPTTHTVQQGSLEIGLVAALAGFFAHNLVDSFFEFPAAMLLAAVLAGFWAGLVYRPTPLSRRWAVAVNLAASLVLVAVTALGLSVTQGLRAYNQAVRATAAGDWEAAAGYLQEAVRLSPRSRFYPRQLGFVYGYLAMEDPVRRSQAIAQYQVTLRAMDQFALDHANLGCLLWENGDRTQAVQEMTQARDLEPDNSAYRLNLGRYLEAEGRYEEAWDEYAWVLSHEPDYLRSDYWQQAPRQDHLPIILERAIGRLVESEGAASFSLARLYANAGYFTDALRIYDELQPTTDAPDAVHAGRAEVFLGMGKLDRAWTELETAIALNPRCAVAYHDRGTIYWLQNRLSEAAQNTEAALFLAPTPASYYQSGQIAEAQGDTQLAQQRYEAAVVRATPSFHTRYAVEVARRSPLAEERLPCLMIPHITNDLVFPTLAEGKLLETEGHFTEAVTVYRRLLSYEPGEPRVKERLEKLYQQHPASCQE
jgi:tetratricopeptide (TPR) repeat protein/O-antigen ligase